VVGVATEAPTPLLGLVLRAAKAVTAATGCGTELGTWLVVVVVVQAQTGPTTRLVTQGLALRRPTVRAAMAAQVRQTTIGQDQTSPMQAAAAVAPPTPLTTSGSSEMVAMAAAVAAHAGAVQHTGGTQGWRVLPTRAAVAAGCLAVLRVLGVRAS